MRTINHRWPPCIFRVMDDGIMRPSLTVREAGNFLGWSESRVRRSVPLYRKGRRVYVRANDVYMRSGHPA